MKPKALNYVPGCQERRKQVLVRATNIWRHERPASWPLGACNACTHTHTCGLESRQGARFGAFCGLGGPARWKLGASASGATRVEEAQVLSGESCEVCLRARVWRVSIAIASQARCIAAAWKRARGGERRQRRRQADTFGDAPFPATAGRHRGGPRATRRRRLTSLRSSGRRFVNDVLLYGTRFQQGAARTRTRALALEQPLVSGLWADFCEN